MSASFQKTLFEPFSRERRPETAEISGTGLGLSIVKNLVDAMGGTISVKSQTGSGSAFIIDFTADFTTRKLPRALQATRATIVQKSSSALLASACWCAKTTASMPK